MVLTYSISPLVNYSGACAPLITFALAFLPDAFADDCSDGEDDASTSNDCKHNSKMFLRLVTVDSMDCVPLSVDYKKDLRFSSALLDALYRCAITSVVILLCPLVGSFL